MKHILVPTDFSDFSLNALKIAAQFARKNNAEVHVLHVVNIPSHEVGIMPFQNQQNVAEGLFILKHIKKKFAALLAEDFLKGLTVHEVVKFDDIYKAAQDYSKELNVGLIVMGTHGTSGFVNKFFIGSNTDKMVRRSNIPVLAVKDEVKTTEFNNIVFAADFDLGVHAAFHKIRDIVTSLGAKLHLVRIITRDDFYFSKPMLEIMEEFAKDQNLENYACHIHNSENVQEGINEFSQQIKADLVATATHGRRGLARLFNGSITEDLIENTSFPVLTAKIEVE
jgi:nucleotide-binding universal stress UspA family protein